MEKEIKCPKCDIELEEVNFLIMSILENNKYWCPECGYEWKKPKKIKKEN